MEIRQIEEMLELRPVVPAPHPAHDALTRFAQGESPRGEAALVIRHLLSRCPQCGRLIVKVAKLPW